MDFRSNTSIVFTEHLCPWEIDHQAKIELGNFYTILKFIPNHYFYLGRVFAVFLPFHCPPLELSHLPEPICGLRY